MIVFIVFVLLCVAVIAGIPILLMRKRGQTTPWDYIYPLLGIVVWFAVAMAEIGATLSLSNFVVEVFWVTVASIAVPWLRWILSHAKAKTIRYASLILTLAPMVVALVIRLTMPTLPE